MTQVDRSDECRGVDTEIFASEKDAQQFAKILHDRGIKGQRIGRLGPGRYRVTRIDGNYAVKYRAVDGNGPEPPEPQEASETELGRAPGDGMHLEDEHHAEDTTVTVHVVGLEKVEAGAQAIATLVSLGVIYREDMVGDLERLKDLIVITVEEQP